MDDFETAVLLALSPQSDAGMRSKAIEFTESVRTSPDGWRFCIAKLTQSYRAEVRFWCLGVLVEWLAPKAARYTDLAPNDRALFRHHVSQFLVRVCEVPTSTSASSAGAVSSASNMSSSAAVPSYVRNKLAQLVAFLVAADFPHEWPSAFADLQQFLNYMQCDTALRIDMYFRVIRAVDDEVTSIRAGQRDKQRTMRVRDALRVSNINEVTSSWAAFLSESSSRALAQGDTAAARYASWALDAAKRFVEWVDISLFANDTYLQFIYAHLTSRGVQKHSVRASCAATFTAIMSKRMDPQAKVALMESLRVRELISAIAFNGLALDEAVSTEAELGVQSTAVEVAAMVRAIAAEALEVLKSSPADSRAVAIVDSALPAAVQLLDIESESDLETEGAKGQALELVASYVTICKKSGGNQNENTALEAILNVVFEKARFPDMFDPAQADDGSGNERFMAMRPSLLTVFRNAVVAAPGLAFSALRQLIVALHALPERKPSDVELQFTLAENVYEVMPEHPAAVELVTAVLVNAPADLSLLVRDAKNDRTQGHQLVSAALMYFDLASRTHRIMMSNGELLTDALRIFFGEYGLRSSDRYTRSRCSYLLLKFVRPLRFLIAERHMDDMINAFQPLLSFQDSTFLSHEDECYLYEAAGLVLGVGDTARDVGRVNYLQALLSPLVVGMDAAARNGEESMRIGVQCLSAAGALSKGFTAYDGERSPRSFSPSQDDPKSAKEIGSRSRALPQEVMSSWSFCLESVLRITERHSANEEVRRRVLFFFHRMVETLGELSIPYVASHLPSMIRMACGAPEVAAIVLLVNQAVCKFQRKMERAMDETLVVVVERVSHFLPKIEVESGASDGSGSLRLSLKTAYSSQSEELRERVELLKVYLAFLHCLMTNKLGSVLLSPKNAFMSEQIALSVVQYGQECWGPSPSAAIISKQCYGILSSMISQWVAPSGAAQGDSGFGSFVSRYIGNMCVRSAVLLYALSGNTLSHHTVSTVVRENVVLQLCAVRHCGASFLANFVSVVLAYWQCSRVSAEQYGNQLAAGDIDSNCKAFAGIIEEVGSKVQFLS